MRTVRTNENARASNSFNTLRLIGALIVLIGHAYIITGTNQLELGTIPLHTVGVCIFFSISGYLITQSWLSDNNVVRYLFRRIIRIVPGLVVAVLGTSFLIGPLATTLTPHAYFSDSLVYQYAIRNSFMLTTWTLPGVFVNIPIHSQVNGSLWTLPMEFLLYLGTPLVVWAALARPRLAFWALVVAAVSICYANLHFRSVSGFSFHGLSLGWGIGLAPYFAMGAALRLANFGTLSERTRSTAFGVACACVAAWALFPFPILTGLIVVAISIAVLSLGLSSWLHASAIDNLGDLSYGTYLWAFPIQQYVMLKTSSGPISNIAISLPIVAILAFASWHLIERPALRLKPKRKALMSDSSSAAPVAQTLP
ncbi:acyltransferase family protein [Sphingomonas sp. PAMC 26617]|uniref:acyltransferase family protein n=1 Tax=Sphingomonas sp. PAMC 26617 TaxID=1112216 RepID=UPI0002887D48|nr:acyltransferase [Sphingomonas sp. PAMC 26617]